MIVSHAPKAHRGVTQLAYVSGVDGLGDVANSDHPCWVALRNGLVVMGLATLLGFSPGTSRWAGVVGVGYTLTRKK